ncbi:hypothetical protein Pcinc_031027 [Petrolisthes cinctipes]|uniref:Uncharacterized protein n=1 Tax=Petrolisthes cinctipes TaxID=88211 RepID=A0AAE1EWY0_PETCI|nr:hypothetical protein Pcinc_031027 [Petrolisthes cinctipes]
MLGYGDSVPHALRTSENPTLATIGTKLTIDPNMVFSSPYGHIMDLVVREGTHVALISTDYLRYTLHELGLVRDTYLVDEQARGDGVLNLSHLQSAFILLVLGMGVALLVLLLELLDNNTTPSLPSLQSTQHNRRAHILEFCSYILNDCPLGVDPTSPTGSHPPLALSLIAVGLVNQSVDLREVKAWWARVWLGVWWLTAQSIIVTVYTGILVSLLMVPVYPPKLHTVEDLAASHLT